MPKLSPDKGNCQYPASCGVHPVTPMPQPAPERPVPLNAHPGALEVLRSRNFIGLVTAAVRPKFHFPTLAVGWSVGCPGQPEACWAIRKPRTCTCLCRKMAISNGSAQTRTPGNPKSVTLLSSSFVTSSMQIDVFAVVSLSMAFPERCQADLHRLVGRRTAGIRLALPQSSGWLLIRMRSR
jgi:hypothetical protein